MNMMLHSQMANSNAAQHWVVLFYLLTVISSLNTNSLKLAFLFYNGSTRQKYHKGIMLIPQDLMNSFKSVLKDI